MAELNENTFHKFNRLNQILKKVKIVVKIW